MLLKHVVEVVLNTASMLQSWVDETEFPNPGNKFGTNSVPRRFQPINRPPSGKKDFTFIDDAMIVP